MTAGQNEKHSVVPKGRRRTDKSLSTERAKTDEKLSNGRKETESKADRAVSAGRAEADETRASTRLDADHFSKKEGAVPSGHGMDERLDGEKRLRRERQTDDETLEAERRNMDAALAQERSQKRALEERILQAERGETDRDLTQERKQTDAESQREREAHVATRAALTTRDEFLAIVSHDLRNPLGSVLMAADLLSEKLYARADDETREYLDVIGRSVGEALRLIADLLDMERMTVGKLGLQIACHDVDDIVQHSVKAFLPQATAKNVSLRVSTQDVALAVKCDRDRIFQVLSNLIGNALKFTPSGGAVTLGAKRTGPDEVRVSVTDTGPGIPEDMRKQVFERFWQIGKHDRRGLGLGLYISTMIVEAHGGRIWVDSEVGQGSSFHFSLLASDQS